ncbi:MAG: hypothetical protein Kow0037_27280 [Calditrichia bacterium]
MMKLRKKTAPPQTEATAAGAEEFFRLPRAEFLVDAVENGQIGEQVTNLSQRVANRFTVEVNDNHMSGAGIEAGDYVVVSRQPHYADGSIVAVQLGQQRLVRRLSRIGGRIYLHCDPESKQVIIVDEKAPDFKILGQVMQIIRQIQ